MRVLRRILLAALAALLLMTAMNGYLAKAAEDEAEDDIDGPEEEEPRPERRSTRPPGYTEDPGEPPALSEDQEKVIEKSQESFEFQAEVSRLLDIIINSLYQHKDVFLRELISNASDALDKIRFLSLTDPAQLGEGDAAKLEIRVYFDRDANTLTIRDTGVGMTKQDLIQNLGTVAKSGTAQFVEALTGGADVNLIGQFGVGFYSVYLVADRVRVVSKHNDDKQHVWESAADATFTVSEDPRGNTLGRGSEITLFLKEDASEYAEENKLKELVKKYSEFITFPIYVRKVHNEQAEVPMTPEEIAQREAEDRERQGPLPEEPPEKVEGEAENIVVRTTTKVMNVKSFEWELVNDLKAIWQRDKDQIRDEEYINFYKAIAKDYDDPLAWTHFSAEGDVEFRSILFVPRTAPYDHYDNYYGKTSSLRLYVRRVLISDDFEDIMPRYLSFIKGVVDSDDLPLNVSRETLQQEKVLRVMGKKLVRKALELLRKLAKEEEKERDELDGGAARRLREEKARKKAEERKARNRSPTEDYDAEDRDEPEKQPEEATPTPEPAAEEVKAEEGAQAEGEETKDKKEAKLRYTKFWKQFGKSVKLGLVEDSSNRSKLAKLLRFRTSKSKDENDIISLEQYIERMQSWQKQIYYIAGESLHAVQTSPFIERFIKKELEVIYLTDPIDEYAVQNLPEFDGHRLQSISKENLHFGDEEDIDKRRDEMYKAKFDPLTSFLSKLYGSKVEKVVTSMRVEETPAVMVTSQYGYSANMERIMRSQTFADPSRAKHLLSKRTLEVNPRHPIITDLLRRASEPGAADNTDTTNLAWTLYDTALLNSGFNMEDPKVFATRMYGLMQLGMNLGSMDLEPLIDVPDPDELDEDEEVLDEDDISSHEAADGAEGSDEAAADDTEGSDEL